ncbi:TetR family transcriptional regulator [Patulibacter sp. NPDC049589]|uniref:acyl-CoA-like ligand-binding transcription factor n=1 Tax=Patulibacter sp. NPDC049589 TaxID=3154731 RepID=UPI003435B3BD
MPSPRLTRSMLEASEAVCLFYVQRGSVAFKGDELADAAGLSERTFYRYFPTKHEAVRPVLDWGSTLLADTIRTRTDLAISEAVIAGFDLGVGGEHAARTRGLFPLLFRDAGLRAVLLQAFHDGEELVRPALAERLGVDAPSVRARVASATTFAVIRVALEELIDAGRDPVDALREAIAELSIFSHARPDHRSGPHEHLKRSTTP